MKKITLFKILILSCLAPLKFEAHSQLVYHNGLESNEIERIFSEALKIYTGRYSSNQVSKKFIHCIKVVELDSYKSQTINFSLFDIKNPSLTEFSKPDKILSIDGFSVFIYSSKSVFKNQLPGETCTEEMFNEIYKEYCKHSEGKYASSFMRYHVYKMSMRNSLLEVKDEYSVDPEYALFLDPKRLKYIEENMKPLNLDSIPKVFR